jgi:HSP20 family protein
MSRRGPFSNFERMRTEIDELFGDVWDRVGQRRPSAFSPSVDVYYCEKPPRAIVKVDLAGVDASAVTLECTGHELVISGERPVQETEGRMYQQVEIASGPFRRIVQLGAEVVPDQASASYVDGVLRVEMPLRVSQQKSRKVPVQRAE